LADTLSLNYTTVARAYTEARKRGLIDSRPGMGTFVRSSGPAVPLRAGTASEMTMNLPPEPDDPALLARMHEGAADVMASSHLYDVLRYQDFGGTPADKEAGVRWLQRFVPHASSERVLVCPGIHSAIAALVSLLARPGELICVEALTYPGIKAITTQLGVLLHPLRVDDDGPLPEDFELACKTHKPRALYCNPTLVNPTTVTLSRGRREALVDIALRYNVPIIEDDAYAMLPTEVAPPMALLAPELTYYVTGFSKCLGAGLRTAYVCAPNARQTQRIAGALRATTVMASPVTNAITTRWVNDGCAEAMLQAVRAESVARQLIAAKHLAHHQVFAHPEGFHLWLPLTTAWSVNDFAADLRSRGVGVVSSAAFSTDGDPPDAVRVCLGGPVTRDECEESLRLIADTLDHPHLAHTSVI
ncbi:MAG: GntR family transcriptional regulator, partial [Rhizobacter sp.]|nr:GntR family transcriptional regulator [Rhizobacter sp.]